MINKTYKKRILASVLAASLAMTQLFCVGGSIAKAEDVNDTSEAAEIIEEAASESDADTSDNIKEDDNSDIISNDTFEETGGYINVDLGFTPTTMEDIEAARREEGVTFLQGPASLPETYSSCDSNYLTSVKHQGGYGTCWAHATAAAAETSIIVNGEKDNDEIDLSEAQLAYNVFNFDGDSDPLGNLSGDYIVLNYGHDKGNWGGNVEFAALVCSNWSSMVDETDEPYSNMSDFENETLSPEDYFANSNIDAYLRNTCEVDSSDLDLMKQMIMEHGGVAASYYSNSSNYGLGTDTMNKDIYYYCPTVHSTNHAIFIVGWDDTLDKSKFTVDGKTPENNGGWLVKNSWGSTWGKNGYFWISYEDKSFEKSAYAFDFTTTRPYDNAYQYDGGLGANYYLSDLGETGIEANVFTANSNETLKAVSFWTGEPNDTYEISVYTGITSTNTTAAISGVSHPEASITDVAAYTGYHTVELNNPVALDAGEKYSVVVKLKNNDGGSVRLIIDSDVQYRFMNSSGTPTDWIHSYSATMPGQSYVKVGNNNWFDASARAGQESNCRVKAFTDDNDDIVSFNLNYSGAPILESLHVDSPSLVFETPSRVGYEFAGWYENAAGTGNQITESYVKTNKRSYRLYAKWKPIIYSISYVLNGGTQNAYNQVDYYIGTTRSLYSPTRSGYNFIGWYTSSGFNTGTEITKITPDMYGNITLYARWEKIDIYHNITYNLNGGTQNGSNPLSYLEGTGTNLYNPTKTACTFAGWYTSNTGGTKVTSIPATATSEYTLYARWTPNTYTINYVMNDGTGVKTSSYIYGNSVTFPTPTRSGYNFAGWYGNSLCTGTRYTYLDPSSYGNVTLYAKWELKPVSVNYRTHVQNVGWQNYVSNGTMSGTSGRSLRLEGINISLNTNANLGVSYTTHVQNIGWQTWRNNGEMSGTSGQSLRLEAIKIQLTGEDADKYDIYYRVHCQNIGWMGWAKNGSAAGTAGFSYRLEGIQIVVTPKNAGAPSTSLGNQIQASSKPYINKNNVFATDDAVPGVNDTFVNYRTHVQNVGWQKYVSNGAMSGTSGRSLRLEGINIELSNKKYSGGISYQTHIQNIGWNQGWKSDGAMAGTSGMSYRLEAIRIKLYGEMANHYDVYYRVHCQNIGWMGWAKNGEDSGSAGYSYRLEGIQIVLVPKGQGAPSLNYGGIKANTTEKYRSR